MNEVIKNAGFHHVALSSNCFDRTIEFYEALGCKVVARWGDEAKKAAMLDLGNGDIFEIFSDGSESPEENSRFCHLAIYTDDPDAAYEAALKAGARSKIAPKDFTLPAENPIDIRIAFVYGLSDEVLEFFKYR